MALLPVLPADSRIYHDSNLRNLLWHLHGVLLSFSFLLLFPLGIVAIRSGSRFSFRYHYLLQLSANIFAITGIVVGIVISKGVGLWHQYLGLVLAVVLLLQPLAGWRHHVVYLRHKRSSIWSALHVWAGRLGIGAAWVNILMGLILRNYHSLVQAGAGVLMLCLIVFWMLWGLGIFDQKSTARGVVTIVDDGESRERLMVGNEFALDDLAEENEDSSEDEGLKRNI